LTSYALDELAWPEVARILEEEPRLMLPVGALEQHGPHLPLGANITIARRVTEVVSQELGILRAPVFSYGVTTPGDPRAGSAGLGRKTLHRAVNELVGRWEDQGVQEFVIVTAHRYEPHLEALLMALSSRSVTTVYDLYQIEVRDLLEEDPEIEHGGEFETSLLLHLSPEQVRSKEVEDHRVSGPALRKYTRGRMPTPPEEGRGVVGRPSLASAEKGAALFQRLTEGLTQALAVDAGRGEHGTAAPDRG
jgi:creatinine amidohydrolase